MKRLFCIISAALLCGTALSASEPKSLGLRVGYGMQLSYQHNVPAGFVEGDFGVVAGQMHGLRATVAYDFVFCRNEWGFCDFSLYCGPGLAGSMYGEGEFAGGICGQFGAELSFNRMPFEFTVDTNPCFWITNDGVSCKFFDFIPMAGFRWKF